LTGLQDKKKIEVSIAEIHYNLLCDKGLKSKNKRWLKAKAKSSLTMKIDFIIILLSCQE